MLPQSPKCPICENPATGCTLDDNFKPEDCKCLECGYNWNAKTGKEL